MAFVTLNRFSSSVVGFLICIIREGMFTFSLHSSLFEHNPFVEYCAKTSEG